MDSRSFGTNNCYGFIQAAFTGEIRAVHEDVCHGNYIQVTLLPVLSKVKTGWCHLSKSVWAVQVLGTQRTDVAACLHETGLDTGVGDVSTGTLTASGAATAASFAATRVLTGATLTITGGVSTGSVVCGDVTSSGTVSAPQLPQLPCDHRQHRQRGRNTSFTDLSDCQGRRG